MSYLDEIPTYKKRTYKKRAPRSNAKRAPTRGQVYGAAAGQLYKDVQLLKSMVNVEYKVQDTTSGPISISSTPIVTLFNGLLRGDDFNQRNGRSVKWTSIYQRMTFEAINTATAPQFVRYILFWVKDPSAAAPTALQMFGTATPNINAMTNLNLRKDFIILLDKVYPLNVYNGGGSLQMDKYYKKTNMHTIFNAGNTGSITDIESGALYAMFWSSTATVSERPAGTIQSRCRYVDN